MSLVGKHRDKVTAVDCVPDDWRCEQLGGFVTLLTGAPFKSELFSTNGGVPLIRIRDLLRGFSETGYVGDYDDRYLVNAGDVLVGMDGEFHVVRWKSSQALLNQRVLKISEKPGHSDEGFLFFFVASVIGKIQDGISATTVKHLSTKDLQNLTAVIPPLPEQQKIAAILTAVDDKLDVIARQIEATQALKQGMMQTLFSLGVGTQDANGSWIPHTEFKESELGDIPVGWEVCTLESVATVERGKFSARPRNDPKYFENGDIPFVQTGDIASVPRYIENASQFLNADGLAVSKRFPAGTIFITIAANIGDVAIAKIPMACPDSLVGIKAHSDACDNTWLYYQLANNKDYFDSQSTQNAQKNINLQVLKPFLFPLPTLKEQQRIAGALTALDDKLEVLGSRQIHYQTLKRGLMQKLLVGEWRVKLDN